MYVFTWICLVGCAVFISLLAFLWALQDGQFTDQNRARFLPLAGEMPERWAQASAWKGKERFLFLGIGVSALCLFAIAFVLSVRAWG